MEMLDYKKIHEVMMENINHDDHPDYSDAYVMSAMYDDPKTGKYRELTEEELESLDSAWVQEQVYEWIY